MSRYLPWLVGLLLIGIYFGVFETLGFRDPEHYATLSHAVSELGLHWPLSIFLWGFGCGGLAVHFFWPWIANPLANRQNDSG